MKNCLQLRYAARQFRLSPVFTATAVLTMALGIGGTTAIFTLIHAVMLRSLPVADPAQLYRIGEGDDCCVEGGPQDRWGMVSYPLFERLKKEAPEFEELTAFQAGRETVTVRREGVDTVGRPLRSEYVSGNYFHTLGVGHSVEECLPPRMTDRQLRRWWCSATAPGKRFMAEIPLWWAPRLRSMGIPSR